MSCSREHCSNRFDPPRPNAEFTHMRHANYDLTTSPSSSRWWEVVWIVGVVVVVLTLTSYLPRARWEPEPIAGLAK
jgi:hypothetical protein